VAGFYTARTANMAALPWPNFAPPFPRDRCAAFITAADAYLRQHGGQTKADTRDVEREGRKVAGLRRREPPSSELVEEALSYIPNDDLSYDEWIRIGLALYAALGAKGRVLWEKWSAQAAKNDPAYSAEKWDSFSGGAQHNRGHPFLARAAEWLARRDASTHAICSGPNGTRGLCPPER
jgi:hypothetical protein